MDLDLGSQHVAKGHRFVKWTTVTIFSSSHWLQPTIHGNKFIGIIFLNGLLLKNMVTTLFWLGCLPCAGYKTKPTLPFCKSQETICERWSAPEPQWLQVCGDELISPSFPLDANGLITRMTANDLFWAGIMVPKISWVRWLGSQGHGFRSSA